MRLKDKVGIITGAAHRMGNAKIEVTNEAEWINLIAKALGTYGRLDILGNNAGISGSVVGDHDELEGWDRMAKTGGVDRQHQLDHGFCWQHQRPSGVSSRHKGGGGQKKTQEQPHALWNKKLFAVAQFSQGGA